MSVNWQGELEKVKQCPQRQDSTTGQLIDLITIANKFGFYDASDYIKDLIKGAEE
jgi:hypothetical protein